jgi:hypothetical protein
MIICTLVLMSESLVIQSGTFSTTALAVRDDAIKKTRTGVLVKLTLESRKSRILSKSLRSFSVPFDTQYWPTRSDKWLAVPDSTGTSILRISDLKKILFVPKAVGVGWLRGGQRFTYSRSGKTFVYDMMSKSTSVLPTDRKADAQGQAMPWLPGEEGSDRSNTCQLTYVGQKVYLDASSTKNPLKIGPASLELKLLLKQGHKSIATYVNNRYEDQSYYFPFPQSGVISRIDWDRPFAKSHDASGMIKVGYKGTPTLTLYDLEVNKWRYYAIEYPSRTSYWLQFQHWRKSK